MREQSTIPVIMHRRDIRGLWDEIYKTWKPERLLEIHRLPDDKEQERYKSRGPKHVDCMFVHDKKPVVCGYLDNPAVVEYIGQVAHECRKNTNNNANVAQDELAHTGLHSWLRLGITLKLIPGLGHINRFGLIDWRFRVPVRVSSTLEHVRTDGAGDRVRLRFADRVQARIVLLLDEGRLGLLVGEVVFYLTAAVQEHVCGVVQRLHDRKLAQVVVAVHRVRYANLPIQVGQVQLQLVLAAAAQVVQLFDFGLILLVFAVKVVLKLDVDVNNAHWTNGKGGTYFVFGFKLGQLFDLDLLVPIALVAKHRVRVGGVGLAAAKLWLGACSMHLVNRPVIIAVLQKIGFFSNQIGLYRLPNGPTLVNPLYCSHDRHVHEFFLKKETLASALQNQQLTVQSKTISLFFKILFMFQKCFFSSI
jgi:hypothetical protein